MPPTPTDMIARLLALDALSGPDQGLTPRLRALLQARHTPLAGAVRLAVASRQDGPPQAWRAPEPGTAMVPLPVQPRQGGRCHG
ncbi:MAG: hypothetical protein ACXIU8_05405 [Alkalilacustris sp.]